MFVNKIESNVQWFDSCSKKCVKRTILYGRYKDYGITVDNYKDKTGKTIEKRFVIWNDLMQKIVNKIWMDGKWRRL